MMRNKKNIFLAMLLCYIFFSCSKDNNPVQPDEQNQAPSAFDLLEVADGDTDIDVRPTLTWGAAIDPDGDMVTYDIYLDTNAQPSQKLFDGEGSTEFTIVDRLSLNTQYYWRVVAKDGQGNETQSQVFSFTTRNFLKVTPFGFISDPMRGLAAAVYNNTIFLTGGYDGNEHLSSVRYWDGDNWNGVSGNADFKKRAGHTLNSMNGQMIAIGGNSGTALSDVRISSDDFGSRWTEVANDKFDSRLGHTTTFFRDTLWLFGGRSGIEYRKSHFTEIGNLDSWQTPLIEPESVVARTEHSAVVFDGKIWIIGGISADSEKVTKDVYSLTSFDDFQKMPDEDVPFIARSSHTSLVYDNKLWVIGGYDTTGKALNDIWYCEKGGEWKQMMLSEDFGARGNHASVVFDDKIFIIGGNNGNDVKSDVWILE